jgi:hypothetical protein
MTVKLMEQKFHAIAVLMKWETNDQAAQEVMRSEKSLGDPAVESIRVSFSSGGEKVDHDKHPRSSKPNTKENSDDDN